VGAQQVAELSVQPVLDLNASLLKILLNPAFPRLIKIGLTNRDTKHRAGELSRQTGVPDNFIVLYDEMVSDAEAVEQSLHEQFGDYRTKSNKEFFDIRPPEAIKALQQLARKYPAPQLEGALSYDLMKHLREHFSDYLDPKIIAVRFLQIPGACYLEVTRQAKKGSSKIISHETLPLWGIVISESLDSAHYDLDRNVRLLQTLDAYDWIMISDLFPMDTAKEIARRWEQTQSKP
jgi:hypothetical protein